MQVPLAIILAFLIALGSLFPYCGIAVPAVQRQAGCLPYKILMLQDPHSSGDLL